MQGWPLAAQPVECSGLAAAATPVTEPGGSLCTMHLRVAHVARPTPTAVVNPS